MNEFTAKDALALTEAALQTDSCYEVLINVIKKAAQSGERSVYFYSNIPEHVMDNLREKGFKVDDLWSQRDGVCYLINW